MVQLYICNQSINQLFVCLFLIVLQDKFQAYRNKKLEMNWNEPEGHQSSINHLGEECGW